MKHISNYLPSEHSDAYQNNRVVDSQNVSSEELLNNSVTDLQDLSLIESMNNKLSEFQNKSFLDDQSISQTEPKSLDQQSYGISDNEAVDIDSLVLNTFPPSSKPEDIEKSLHKLARGFKFNLSFSQSLNELKPHLKTWMSKASEMGIALDLGFGEVWAIFSDCYENAKYPLEALETAHSKAKDKPLFKPSEYLDTPKMITLLNLCYYAGDREGTFFLAQTTAAKMIDVDQRTVGRWLKVFVREGYIKLLKKGRKNKYASEYKWLLKNPANGACYNSEVET